MHCLYVCVCGGGGDRVPIHMHIAQEENLNHIPTPSRHEQCDTGIDITQATTLS